MKHIKRYILALLVVLGLYVYASSGTARSLYSTKADANADYVTLGTPNQEMTISQTFQPDSSVVQTFAVTIHPFTHEADASIHWTLKDDSNQQVLSSGDLTLTKATGNQTAPSSFNLDWSKLTFDTSHHYTVTFTGNNGDIFMKTATGPQNISLSVDGNQSSEALVTKLVYGNFHLETFLVLLGLTLYIIVFMGAMLKLFK